MRSSFKILPVLIIVAMLTFSVRIADIVIGFSAFSGKAQAEEKEEDSPQELTGSKSIADQIEARKAGKSENSYEEDEESKVTEVSDDTMPEMEWRDASDQELDYSNIRMEIFGDLSERRKGLEKREKEIMAREALLRAAEQELDRKYQELSSLRKQIEGLLKQQSDEEKARITSLVKVYEGMKPKDAARIFDTLDLDILVAVMSQMSERKLSPVLAAMNPERARTITIMLAEQKKLPELPQIQ